MKPVSAISSWSFNLENIRGRQLATLYGSNSATDPGWNVKDPEKFTPLGSIDTASLPPAQYISTSLCAPDGQSLGSYRWIAWETFPIETTHRANTAWQEFHVDIGR